MREQPVNVFLTEQGQEVIRYALFYICWYGSYARYAALVSEAAGSTSAAFATRRAGLYHPVQLKVNILNAVVTGQ